MHLVCGNQGAWAVSHGDAEEHIWGPVMAFLITGVNHFGFVQSAQLIHLISYFCLFQNSFLVYGGKIGHCGECSKDHLRVDMGEKFWEGVLLSTVSLSYDLSVFSHCVSQLTLTRHADWLSDPLVVVCGKDSVYACSRKDGRELPCPLSQYWTLSTITMESIIPHFSS